MDNGWQAEIPSTPETTVDIEEAHGRLESKEFGANLDASLQEAQESLHHRRKAQTLRDRSQSVFAQSESIMKEAICSVEAAGKAFGVGADSAANTDAAAEARRMAQTLKARLKKNQSAYQDVLRQAHGPKELAIQDLVAALDSLNIQLINVKHELEESAKASAMADSTKESTIQDLLAVHTMWNGFASQLQEPLAQPDPHPARYPLTETIEQGNQYPAEGDTEVGGHSAIPKELLIEPTINAAGGLPRSAGESASEDLHRRLAGLMAMPEENEAKFRNGNSNGTKQPTPAITAPEPMKNSPVRTVVSRAELAQTYNGRVYLMFDASLTRKIWNRSGMPWKRPRDPAS